MAQLYLLRHGQSCWNLENRFTGWVNVALTPTGLAEAHQAGLELADIHFDCIFTSTLIRAQQTALAVVACHQSKQVAQLVENLAEAKQTQGTMPVVVDQRFNERHYGDLQGQNKQELINKFGAEQVHLWRRSYRTCPPNGESLADTATRTHAAFTEMVLPLIQQGQNILIVAHGNSLRSLIMRLEDIAVEQIDQCECQTGQVIGYNYVAQNQTFQRINREGGL